MLKVGVISDTHGYLDPAIFGLFRGVHHIRHAGDVGQPSIIFQLEQIAPVTAVLGNTDIGLSYSETEVAVLREFKFLVHHIVDPGRLSETLARRIAAENPHVVVFGHTHQKLWNSDSAPRFLNPGYSGRPKPGQFRSAALLTCDGKKMDVQFLSLQGS